MNEPLVSILIPVYNREHLVGETIESAINQTYKNIEIIIVDNCSTDNTWKVLNDYAQKDSRIKLFQNSENIGPVRNWKRCIDEAKGEYAKILFSDDLISENFVEETIKCFDDDTAFVLSKIAVFGSDKELLLSKYERIRQIKVKEYLNNILLFDKFRFPVSPGAALFRTKDLINAIEIEIPNPLNLDFPKFGAGNDLLLYLNTSINYSSIKIVNETIAFFRFHSDSFTISNRLSSFYEYSKLYFINKNFPRLLPKFKVMIWSRMKRNIVDYSFYRCIEGPIDIIFLISQFFKRLFLKV